ncbi:TadE/TadG family type IV pilus assembly protein [Palleronia sp. LCG004]|uniref:TadE/TadG family type IV pilus assembly protein n=1 Tax=Palleronia sp. LCG004 TaxID=3079304 RepID=UPI00294365FE|nr:TadE/TadG family type IV pilus assembly protein [Palleronia sp. LCG004]WOI57055.1 TadE/TadG family type IV pilus assembly protein [Palleronia sp. LCG004]
MKDGNNDRARSFLVSEEGSLVVFGIFLFAVMLIAGGIGVDILRHDSERLRMQSTLDQAVLSAANLEQLAEPEAVVRDYFSKAGLLSRLGDVSVVESINSRLVSATATADVNTMFLRAVGIDTLKAATASAAREDVRDVEVSVVLDISGSMGGNNRMTYLRTAAKDFVTAVLSGRTEGKQGDISVSLVPYQTEVNAGRPMLNRFKLSVPHDYSNCVDFLPQDYQTTAVDFTKTRPQSGHYDPYADGRSGTSIAEHRPRAAIPCRSDGEIVYLSENEALLHARIDALKPGGGTSIDAGVKWGTALLDPSLRPAITALANSGHIDKKFSGRPYDYGEDNRMKVLVIMTDGENFSTEDLKPEYNGTALSDIWLWRDPNGGSGDSALRISVEDTEKGDRDQDGVSNEKWYIPSLRRWEQAPIGGTNARQLTWREVWSIVSVDWHAYYYRYLQNNDTNEYNLWHTQIYDPLSAATKNIRLERMCSEAKAKGILVFSIAMDISESYATRMQNCASSANNYFNVKGQKIDYAFAAISNAINQLRLVE